MNTTVTTLSPPVLAARDIRKSYGKGTARFDALAAVSLCARTAEKITETTRRVRTPLRRSREVSSKWLQNIDSPEIGSEDVWLYQGFWWT